MIWEDKGRWHVLFEKNYAIVATESEAEEKLRVWKGEPDSWSLTNEISSYE